MKVRASSSLPEQSDRSWHSNDANFIISMLINNYYLLIRPVETRFLSISALDLSMKAPISIDISAFEIAA